ncbi:hypothetical protein [Halobacteriovorax sp. HLS]|uniref:hypothetical protein n=1 Tax=Halobacteriovorax sp. HLS TaxID=2234000 RepID=UPI000FDC9D8F|nr:hypothetical protein [Halobacteriovorax sp. HLS]
MKKIILLLTLLFNLNSFADEVGAFTIVNARGTNASVFLVAGGQGISSYEVQRVYRKIGTFAINDGEAEVPASSFERYGWRGPSHVIVVTHNQDDLALSKFRSDELARFEDPTYSIQSDRVAPTAENLKYVDRKAILLKRVRSSSKFQF